MKLTAQECAWIDGEMQWFEIRYQEIYDELLDHVITAVEQIRTNGDTRSVETIYNEVIAQQFGGRSGVEAIAKTHEKAYRAKIYNMVFSDYKRGIIFRILTVTILSTALDMILPESPIVTIALYVAMMVALLSMGIYLLIKMQKIKKVNGRESIRKTNVIMQTFWPFAFFNLLFNIPNFIHHFWGFNAKKFVVAHPIIPLYLLGYTIFYAISCYRVYEKEIKIA